MTPSLGAVQEGVGGIFKSIGSTLGPLGAKLSKSVSTGRQLLSERMGSAEVTELPQEYKELEERVDKIRIFHESMVKITRAYTKHIDYDIPLGDTIGDLTTQLGSSLGSLATSAASKIQGGAAPPPKPPSKEEPLTLSHAIARATGQAAQALGTEEPTGAALQKVAAVSEKIGNAKIRMDNDITERFYKPFMNTQTGIIMPAMKARKDVQTCRLNYDACKQRVKTAKPEKLEAARHEMEKAEDEFVAAVEDAMNKMKAVVTSPQPLANLADLVAAQLAYYKEAYESLSELSPEIDELQITNEALNKVE
ncbi:hypothetical protein DFJ74DRAFT_609501 [Hyaloraphidium curvatum]|nr:hypothetical protein DFJ74DRAFT_609501 [Hyaloraphidium curvatum]